MTLRSSAQTTFVPLAAPRVRSRLPDPFSPRPTADRKFVYSGSVDCVDTPESRLAPHHDSLRVVTRWTTLDHGQTERQLATSVVQFGPT